jgi:hypothetical protein
MSAEQPWPWMTNPDGTETRRCQRPYCPHEVVRGPGRPPLYCSDACKQMDYRNRKARAAREAEAQRRYDAKLAHVTQLVTVGVNTWNGSNDLRRTAAREGLIEHLVRTIMLHNVS